MKLAVLNLNRKLRRRGNISSYEINTSRDQNTGNNLILDDKDLRNDQLEKRKDKVDVADPAPINVGDTVKIKNKSDKHKANDMFVVTSKNEDNVELQKLLHPLSRKPGKIMSKTYNTNQKHLVTIHRPKFPIASVDEAFEEEKILTNDKVKSFWNPINQQFYNDDDDTEDENDRNIEDILPFKFSPIHHIPSDPDLDWDSSPEQYRLINQEPPSDNDLLSEAIRPRRLFATNDDDNENNSLTESTTDEEVFNKDQFATPPSAPRLNRSKAFRLQKNPLAQSLSEPRVTRMMLHSNYRKSTSNPTSPSSVTLNQVQNLNTVLNPNAPIHPEVVNLGQQVQNLDHALEVIENDDNQRRRSSRNAKKVDYKKLHNFGRRQ